MYIWQQECNWMLAISFIEKRIDIIHHCLNKLAWMNKEIKTESIELIEIKLNRRESSKYSWMKSVFIQFNTQFTVYIACQTLLNVHSLHSSAQHINVFIWKIRWSTFTQWWWNQYIWSGLMWTAIASLLIMWMIFIAFIDFLSQITILRASVLWLHWISDTLAWLNETIQDVLSQLMLIALNTLLLLILCIITDWQNLSMKTTVELLLQKYYFVFLFMQNFLMMLLSSSMTAIVQELFHDLKSVSALLIRNLLKISNYFFFYLTLQDLSVSAGAFLQAEDLINWLILALWMNCTLRQKWKRQMSLLKI